MLGSLSSSSAASPRHEHTSPQPRECVFAFAQMPSTVERRAGEPALEKNDIDGHKHAIGRISSSFAGPRLRLRDPCRLRLQIPVVRPS